MFLTIIIIDLLMLDFDSRSILLRNGGLMVLIFMIVIAVGSDDLHIFLSIFQFVFITVIELQMVF